MAELLKNLYNEEFIKELCRTFKKVYPQFNSNHFTKIVFTKEWKNKELKARMRHISESLHQVLPQNYSDSVSIIEKTAKTIDHNGFEYMIFPDFVEVYGGNDWKHSMRALESLTTLASSEFAVRPFIHAQPEKMMKVMLKWSKSKNYHVRRLASEGSRPRLPWAMGLPGFKDNPALIIPILENLKEDPELYVRRRVANNLNDIAKDNPKVVIKLLRQWNKIKTPEMKYIISHSLRSLEKQGNVDALKILGYSPNIKLKSTKLKITPSKIKIGDKLKLDIKLTNLSTKQESIVIDYVVYHVKANGTLTPKVFKWSKKKINKTETIEISKTHKIEEISTRKYYSGKHEVHVQVNGKVMSKSSFMLSV